MLSSLLKSKSVKRHAKNSVWMLLEYFLKLVAAIFVTIYIARYLGPERFGVLSYSLSVVAVFMAVARLGMESILVRDLAKNVEQRQAYMATAFSLMLTAAVAAVIVLGVLVYFFEPDGNTRIYIWIISSGMLFQTLLVVDYNFQSQVKAKFSSVAKSLALAASVTVKLVLVWSGAELLHFAVAYAADHFLIGFFLLLVHFKNRQVWFFSGARFCLYRPLIKSAWPMILSAVAATLYMRLDQLMIKNMLGAHDVGLYAAAVKVYEGWIIIPYVISISLLPAIVNLKQGSVVKYEKSMAALFSILFWSSFFAACMAALFGKWIIGAAFGSEFLAGSSVLSIVMWSALFSSIGSVTARYLTVEHLEKKIAIRTFAGLVLNIVLNLFLIPVYGIEGAALATLLTLFFANYVINYLDRDLGQLVSICNSSITLKWLRSAR